MSPQPLVSAATIDRSRAPHADERIWVSVFLAVTLILLALVQLLFALHHSYPVPYWDESGYIPYVTGAKPITAQWLWSPANEHRIPLIRVVYVILARITGLDQQLMNAFSVTMLAAAAALMMGILRKLNGRSQYSDAIVPLVLLHLGHWNNITWPSQLQFILPTCLLFLSIAILATNQGHALLAPTVLAIFLCGANGLPIGLALLPLVVWNGYRHPRRAGINFACALLAIAYTGFYFVGLNSLTTNPPRPFVFREGITEGLHVCSQAFGPFVRQLWPYPAWAVFLLLAVCLSLVVRALCKAPADRWSAAGLGLALSGTIGLGFGIGLGRTILGPGAGFEIRYALLMTPVLIVMVLIADRFAPRGAAGFLRHTLLLGAALLYWPNGQQQIADLEAQVAVGQQLEAAVGRGASIDSLAAEFGSRWMFYPAVFAEHMREMARARMGIYRRYEPPADAGR